MKSSKQNGQAMIKTLSISLLLAIGLIFSGYLIHGGIELEIEYVDVTIPITKTQTAVIYNTTELTKTLTTTRWIFLDELKEFETREELETWLEGQRKPPLNSMQFGGYVRDWNCVDYAYWLQQQAQYDGYYMTLWTLTPDQYDWWFGTENIEYWWGAGVTHMVCGVIISNQVYLIDASASLKIYPDED